MVGKAIPARARDTLVAVGITLALLLAAGFTVLALAYAIKSAVDGKWADAYDAAKRGGEGVVALGFVVYVWARYGLVAVRRIWFSTAELARDRAVDDAARAAGSARERAERARRERFPDDPSLAEEAVRPEGNRG